TIRKDEFDMASPQTMRNDPTGLADVLQTFDKNAAAVKEAFAKMDDGALTRPWTLRHGPQVLHTQPRVAILRIWCLNHMIHHRAQLCVLLRLLGRPVPAVYFNSADEPEWTFA
ncbi:MAG TPA: DinB family protein, partial [Tepidisphaeraceae bacterium]